MNCAQMLRLALYMADAVNEDNTTDPLFTQQELLSWATDATWELEAELRRAKEDYGLLVMQSGDSNFRWAGYTYDPSSMELLSTTTRYTLPPDLITLRSIRCITTGYNDLRFREVDPSSDEFKDAQSYGFEGGTSDAELLYCIVGENTFMLAYAPSTTLATEITYIARSAPLQIYTTGTVTTVTDSASVSGGSTAWVDNEIRNNVELIVSADATAPKIVSQTTGGTWVDPSARYSPVQSIDSDGGLTLSGAWLTTGVVGVGYMLATRPTLPHDHHMTIVDRLVERIKFKGENRPADAYDKLVARGKDRMIRDVTERQLNTRRTVEDYIAG